MNRQEASLYFRLGVVPYSPVPPNNAHAATLGGGNQFNSVMSPNIMSVARRIGGFFALLLFFEGLFLIAWAAYGGFTPSTWKGWVALLVLGPPAFLVGDWVAARVVSRIDRRGGAPEDAVVSGRRVLLALAVALVYCGLFVLVSWLLGITFPT